MEQASAGVCNICHRHILMLGVTNAVRPLLNASCLLLSNRSMFTCENPVSHQNPFPTDLLVWLEEQSDIYV